MRQANGVIFTLGVLRTASASVTATPHGFHARAEPTFTINLGNPADYKLKWSVSTPGLS